MEQGVTSATGAAHRLRLLGLTLDLSHGELRTASNELADLRKQALDVLLLLGANAGHVVSKEELMRSVWPNVVVGEDSLVQAIADIRRVLGDDRHDVVRTVPRRGYMLLPDPPTEPEGHLASADAAAAPATLLAATQPAGTGAAAVAAKRGRWIPIGLTLVLVAAVVVGIALVQHNPTDKASSSPGAGDVPARSLVVLPLESEGVPAEERWFADAVTADLTRTLGRWPNVLVIDQGSARKYKGEPVDPRDVARELGVRYVIRGAVTRDGERVRLDLALVDGESGAQRWSEQIDVERARLAQSIDDIKGGLAKTLTIEVGRAVGERAAKMRPFQVEADDLAMRGFAVYLRGVSKENFLEARQLFEQAVAKDPDSVRGLAGVSMTNSFGAIMHWVPDREASVRRSEEALARLVSLDPRSDLTLMSRASVANVHGDWDGLLLVAGDLVEHYPSNPTSHHHRCSALLRLGAFEAAIPSCERAIRISPRDSRAPIWNGLIGMNYFMLGRYALAVDYVRQTVTANPNIAGYWPVLVASLALDGRREEGAQVLKEFVGRHPGFEASKIPMLWDGKHPDFIKGRDLVVATVREMGLP
jgi:TolB-like protein/DNA-binding winged helix-turn-helix (wHTH) protein